MDKVIVLLSPEYKRKADDCERTHGVKQERNVIADRLASNPENVILARLPSQKEHAKSEILPVMYSGENIIDLASEEVTNGYNLLFRTLAGKSVVGSMAAVSDKVNEGKAVR